MESDDELREQQRAADQAEALPWTVVPTPRWWEAPAIGLVAGVYIFLNALPGSGHGAWAFPLLLLLVVPFRRWRRTRRGTEPAGPQPPELDRVRTRLIAGAILLWVVCVGLGLMTPAWVAGVGTGLLATAFVTWHQRSEAAAAARVRARLA